MSILGTILLSLSALIYHFQAKEGMYFVFRPVVLTLNITTLIWFCFLHLVRFRNAGRSCSGDFIETAIKPANFELTYLLAEGYWFYFYIVAHYIVFFICKVVSILISNQLEEELESIKAREGFV